MVRPGDFLLPSGASLKAGQTQVRASTRGKSDMKVLRSTSCRLVPAAVALCAALIVFAGASLAATVTTTFNVTANVVSVCSVTATSLGFGTYNASLGAANDTTSTVSVTCSNGTTYTTALDAGLGSGAAVNNRLMTSGANTLGYGLYTTSARTTIWGDGNLSTATLPGTGNGSAQSITVFGRVPANQYVTAGSYTDTITATVTY